MKIKKWGHKIIPFLSKELNSRKNWKTAATFLKEHPQPKLSKEEKNEIDYFWKQYGIKFPDYSWYEMYYGVTGIHDPRFIPHPVLITICYPYYNSMVHGPGWDDKNVYEKLTTSCEFPYSLCHCINGNFYDHEWRFYSKDDILQLSDKIIMDLGKDTDFICKETCNTSFGKGVKKVEINSIGGISNFLNQYKSKNFILQKRIAQHSFFNQFNPTSANIIRVISWRYEGIINILSASIRFGMKGSFTDVAFVNGKEIVNVVGIDNDGYVKDRFVSLDGNNSNPPQIREKKVPSWDKLLETVKKAHQDLLFFDFVAWDFMIDVKGDPICIEYNIHWPGSVLYQYAHGPLAGDYTNQFLDFLKTAPSSMIPIIFRK